MVPLHCPLCEKSFKRKEEFQRHGQEFHVRKRIPCHKCSHKLEDSQQFRKHFKRHHKGTVMPTKRSLTIEYTQTAFCCGVCGIVEPAPETDQAKIAADRYFRHVAGHFTEGLPRLEWSYTRVFLGLLKYRLQGEWTKVCTPQKERRLEWGSEETETLLKKLETQEIADKAAFIRKVMNLAKQKEEPEGEIEEEQQRQEYECEKSDTDQEAVDFCQANESFAGIWTNDAADKANEYVNLLSATSHAQTHAVVTNTLTSHQHEHHGLITPDTQGRHDRFDLSSVTPELVHSPYQQHAGGLGSNADAWSVSSTTSHPTPLTATTWPGASPLDFASVSLASDGGGGGGGLLSQQHHSNCSSGALHGGASGISAKLVDNDARFRGATGAGVYIPTSIPTSMPSAAAMTFDQAMVQSALAQYDAISHSPSQQVVMGGAARRQHHQQRRPRHHHTLSSSSSSGAFSSPPLQPLSRTATAPTLMSSSMSSGLSGVTVGTAATHSVFGGGGMQQAAGSYLVGSLQQTQHGVGGEDGSGVVDDSTSF